MINTVRRIRLDPRRRKLEAEARLLELKLDEEERRLIDFEQARQMFLRMMTMQNQVDDALPGRIAGSDAKLHEKVKQEVRRGRQDLADRIERFVRTHEVEIPP